MVILVHPILEWIHFWRSAEASEGTWLETVGQSLKNAFSPSMLAMTGLLAFVGAFIGAALALHHRRLLARRMNTDPAVTAEQLAGLIAGGENEMCEFKSSMRWDRKAGAVNKVLEQVIAKTLCGFMNGHGGVLLIGVDDQGGITGIEADWKSLRHPDSDHFEQRLISLIAAQLGSAAATQVRCEFLPVHNRTVAIAKVLASPIPIFCKDGNAERYYVRAGNTTRELNTREAIAYITQRRTKP